MAAARPLSGAGQEPGDSDGKAPGPSRRTATPGPAPFLSRLRLADFRSYEALSIELGPGPIVLCGANGAGKTNLIEAVSMLSSGQGLRRAPLAEIGRIGGSGRWSIFASVESRAGVRLLGTGWSGKDSQSERSAGRNVRIDGQSRAPAALSEVLEIAWLTPAMDGLFMGPASDRRRFLDKMVAAFDAGHRVRLNRYDLAMRQRNRLLELARARPAELEGLELVMAEIGVAIAAARLEMVTGLASAIADRVARSPDSPFPWADIALDGRLEGWLGERPAVEVEDDYLGLLAGGRERDRAAGRALEGPHRSDLLVGHGQKEMPAKVSSTGEQKGLLIGLVLAQAELLALQGAAGAPVLLLDEIAAHLDEHRRSALFAEIVALGSQAFMTGTERAPFAALEGRASFLGIEAGTIEAGG